MTREALFWSKVDKRRWNQCWPWMGTRSRHGYGVFSSPAGASAHRASHYFATGPIKDGLFVLHSCHNPPCVNPRHLRAGTHQENMLDKTYRRWETDWRPKPMCKRWDQSQPPLPSALLWCAGAEPGGDFNTGRMTAARIYAMQKAQGVAGRRPRCPSMKLAASKAQP